MKEIGEDQLIKVIEGFTSEFSRFNTRKIGSAVLEEAETLVNRLGKSIGLRALDAIHLATFSLLNQVKEMPFVATDESRFPQLSIVPAGNVTFALIFRGIILR